MSIRKLALGAAAIAMLAALSLGLSATAGADTGYPGTTTVTTVPGGTSPGGSTSPGGTGPSDPCATSPGACSPGGTPGASVRASGGTLAFTGADLLALIVGALFLLAMGTLMVVFTRRRARSQHI